jgi:hypothetical protein
MASYTQKNDEHTLWTLSFSMITRVRRVSKCSGSDMVLLKVHNSRVRAKKKKNLVYREEPVTAMNELVFQASCSYQTKLPTTD